MVYLSRYFLLKWDFLQLLGMLATIPINPYNTHTAQVATYDFKSPLIATRITAHINLTRYKFRLLPFRSPLLRELTIVLFSCRYWEVSLPCVISYTAMNSLWGNWVWPQLDYSIRKSSDQSLLDSYPKLIAAYYVLHRSFVPRHSPYALNLLNWNYFLFSFKCATTDSVIFAVIHSTYLNSKNIYRYPDFKN